MERFADQGRADLSPALRAITSGIGPRRSAWMRSLTGLRPTATRLAAVHRYFAPGRSEEVFRPLCWRRPVWASDKRALESLYS